MPTDIYLWTFEIPDIVVLSFAGVEGIGDINAVKLITKFGMFLFLYIKKNCTLKDQLNLDGLIYNL
jgi:5'-3' exonuclease